MTQFKYISSITSQELEDDFVIPCCDENNDSCILIKNSLKKTVQSSYSTDNLDVKLNRVLTRESTDYYFHIIRAKKSDGYSKQQFETIFQYVFKKIDKPIDDVELATLITSLEDYFKITPEKNKRDIQVGVFGELLTIKYLYDIGYQQIINKYHTNFYSKHDVEISQKLRLEIKTTTSEKRIHHFKHNQIMRRDVTVLVSSVLLEESKEGLSLREMFEMVIPLFSDPDSLFALKKLMIKCGLENEEYNGLSFSYEKAMDDIKFYDADSLPKIPQDSFDGVYDIEYDVDCSNCEWIEPNNLLNVLGD
jgi:hypothetical protein